MCLYSLERTAQIECFLLWAYMFTKISMVDGTSLGKNTEITMEISEGSTPWNKNSLLREKSAEDLVPAQLVVVGVLL